MRSVKCADNAAKGNRVLSIARCVLALVIVIVIVIVMQVLLGLQHGINGVNSTPKAQAAALQVSRTPAASEDASPPSQPGQIGRF